MWSVSPHLHFLGCYQCSPVTLCGVWWFSRGGCLPGCCDVQGRTSGSGSICCLARRDICRSCWLRWALQGAPWDGMLSTSLGCPWLRAAPPWLCRSSLGSATRAALLLLLSHRIGQGTLGPVLMLQVANPQLGREGVCGDPLCLAASSDTSVSGIKHLPHSPMSLLAVPCPGHPAAPHIPPWGRLALPVLREHPERWAVNFVVTSCWWLIKEPLEMPRPSCPRPGKSMADLKCFITQHSSVKGESRVMGCSFN